MTIHWIYWKFWKWKTRNKSINQCLIEDWYTLRNTSDAWNNFYNKTNNYLHDFMYMYSDNNYDYFKHHDTRKYISVRYVSLMTLIKNIILWTSKNNTYSSD